MHSMYKILISSIIIFLALSLLSMQELYFSKFLELPREIQRHILTNALDKNSIAKSLHKLLVLNKDCYYQLLSVEYLARKDIIKKLAEDLDTSTHVIALHIIKIFNLKQNNLQLAQKLLQENPANQEFNQELLDAIVRDNRVRVQNLIREGADVNAIGDMGLTALGWAIAWNRQEIVALLINAGAHYKGGHSILSSEY